MNQIFDYARKSEPEPVGMKKAVFKQFTESVLSCLEEADRRSFSIDKIIEVTNCTDIDQLENMVSIQAEEIIRLLIGKQKRNTVILFLRLCIWKRDTRNLLPLMNWANHVHMNRSYISHLFKKRNRQKY